MSKPQKPLMYSGFHAVDALLRHRPEAVLELFVQDSRAEREEPRLAAMIQSARDFGIAVQRARREVLEKHAGPQHQGIVARARPRKPGDEMVCSVAGWQARRPWLLILEQSLIPITGGLLTQCRCGRGGCGGHSRVATLPGSPRWPSYRGERRKAWRTEAATANLLDHAGKRVW